MAIDTIISPTLHTAGLAGVEVLINQLLSLDPAAAYQLQAMDQHCFAIHCSTPTIELFLIPNNGKLRLCSVYDTTPETRLSGALSDYIELLQADDPASQLINGNLQLHGDSQALIQLQKLLHGLELDWEAALSKPFGDIIGHQLGKGLRGSLSLTDLLIKRAKAQLQDFLLYESGSSVSAAEVDTFNQQVDELKQRTERLNAKFERWQAAHQSG